MYFLCFIFLLPLLSTFIIPSSHTLLAFCSANIIKKPYLIPFKYDTIYRQHLAGLTIFQIAKALNTSELTVKYTLYNIIHNENQKDKLYSNRLKQFINRIQYCLVYIMCWDPCITYSDLKEQLETIVSTLTLYCEIKAYSLTNWLAKK